MDELNALGKLAGSAHTSLRVSIEELSTKVSLISLAFPMGKMSAEEASYLDLLSLILVGDQRGLIHRACDRAGVDIQFVGVTPVIHGNLSTLLSMNEWVI